MNEEDILTDFEEKPERWRWHDELTFTAMLIVFLPVILITAFYKFITTNNRPKQ